MIKKVLAKNSSKSKLLNPYTTCLVSTNRLVIKYHEAIFVISALKSNNQWLFIVKSADTIRSYIVRHVYN